MRSFFVVNALEVLIEFSEETPIAYRGHCS